MPVLGIGRYSDFLRRFLGIAGSAASSGRELNPDINAILDLHSRAEFAFLQGEKRCHATVTADADAAAPSVVNFFNDSTWRMLVVITGIWVRHPTANVISLTQGIFAADTGASSRTTADTRWGTAIPSQLVRFGTQTANVRFLDLQQVAVDGVNRTWVLPHPIVLGPGTGFSVSPGVANEAIQVQASWYERALSSSEIDT